MVTLTRCLVFKTLLYLLLVYLISFGLWCLRADVVFDIKGLFQNLTLYYFAHFLFVNVFIYASKNTFTVYKLQTFLTCVNVTKVSSHLSVFAESLHGDALTSQLSRLMWLYLNSGQEVYLQAVKGMVLECAHTSLNRLCTLAAC